jgi:hypothetical protein
MSNNFDKLLAAINFEEDRDASSVHSEASEVVSETYNSLQQTYLEVSDMFIAGQSLDSEQDDLQGDPLYFDGMDIHSDPLVSGSDEEEEGSEESSDEPIRTGANFIAVANPGGFPAPAATPAAAPAPAPAAAAAPVAFIGQPARPVREIVAWDVAFQASIATMIPFLYRTRLLEDADLYQAGIWVKTHLERFHLAYYQYLRDSLELPTDTLAAAAAAGVRNGHTRLKNHWRGEQRAPPGELKTFVLQFE